MRPRLVVSDLDGTLLDEASRISSTTVAALERAARAGAEVVVATGRSRWSALPILAGVDVVRWLICSNGAVVYDRHTEEVVVSRPMGDEQAAEVMADGPDPGRPSGRHRRTSMRTTAATSCE
jgi:HAD superfamily hydrolase (TIGR01484 family)